jgi:hypothetical protein
MSAVEARPSTTVLKREEMPSASILVLFIYGVEDGCLLGYSAMHAGRSLPNFGVAYFLQH